MAKHPNLHRLIGLVVISLTLACNVFSQATPVARFYLPLDVLARHGIDRHFAVAVISADFGRRKGRRYQEDRQGDARKGTFRHGPSLWSRDR